jgi:hypothetical protein
MTSDPLDIFQAKVLKYFTPLIQNYGYWIEEDLTLPLNVRKNLIILASSKTGIEIVLERGSQILVQIGQITKPRDEWFVFTDVIGYFYPGTVPYEFSDHPDFQERIETQLKRLSHLILEYCTPILRGDFSMQGEIKALEEKRVAAMLVEFKKINSRNERQTN